MCLAKPMDKLNIALTALSLQRPTKGILYANQQVRRVVFEDTPDTHTHTRHIRYTLTPIATLIQSGSGPNVCMYINTK